MDGEIAEQPRLKERCRKLQDLVLKTHKKKLENVRLNVEDFFDRIYLWRHPIYEVRKTNIQIIIIIALSCEFI